MSISIKVTRTARKKSGTPKGTVNKSTKLTINGNKFSISKSGTVNVGNIKSS